MTAIAIVINDILTDRQITKHIIHKTLKDLSTNKDETFSDIIAKLADYYKKGRPKK
jgi:chromosomal replication initiation ATPase DnaA